MRFRNLAEEMTEKDLKEVLEIIYPDTIFSGYKRMEREIKIFFKLDNNTQYEFQKYMVAHGYSELWVNNKYADEAKIE